MQHLQQDFAEMQEVLKFERATKIVESEELGKIVLAKKDEVIDVYKVLEGVRKTLDEQADNQESMAKVFKDWVASRRLLTSSTAIPSSWRDKSKRLGTTSAETTTRRKAAP